MMRKRICSHEGGSCFSVNLFVKCVEGFIFTGYPDS